MRRDPPLTNPWQLDAVAVAAQLGVDPAQGLAAAEARQRLAQDGPNELHTEPPTPAWRHLLAQFQDPVVYLLLQVAVVNLSLLNRAFGTVPLTLSQWALCVAMSSVVLWFGELRKFLLQRKDAMQHARTIHDAELGF